MQPDLSLSMEATLRAAQLELRRMPREELIAHAEFFMARSARYGQLLCQAMRHIDELELQEAVRISDAKKARWGLNRIFGPWT